MKSKAQFIAVAVMTLIAGAAVANFGNQQQRGPGSGPIGVQLTEAEESGILLMREEEKLARDVYLKFYDVWGAEIFANISESEQWHMDAIERLITRYGLEDPIEDDTVGVFTTQAFTDLYEQFVLDGSESLEAALNIGIEIEKLDIADLEKALEETSARSVSRVFENLLAGSQNHLSAFQNAVKTGTTNGWQQVGSADGSCCVCPQCGNICQGSNQTGTGGNQNGNGTGQGGNGPSQGNNNGQAS